MPDNSGAFSDEVAKQPSQSRRKAFFFAMRFCLFSAMGISFLYLAPVDALLQPLLSTLAKLAGALLQVGGLDVVILGQKIVLPGVFGINIVAECSGAPQLILFISGVLAYPTTWRSRLYRSCPVNCSGLCRKSCTLGFIVLDRDILAKIF